MTFGGASVLARQFPATGETSYLQTRSCSIIPTTADWYDAYPGNDQLDIAFGRKYRVIRGGGAIDYYGANSTRRCTDRARSVP